MHTRLSVTLTTYPEDSALRNTPLESISRVPYAKMSQDSISKVLRISFDDSAFWERNLFPPTFEFVPRSKICIDYNCNTLIIIDIEKNNYICNKTVCFL